MRRVLDAKGNHAVEAANAGDTAAAGILRDAAAELVRLVEATREGLGFPSSATVPVSYSGGVLTAPEVLREFTAAVAGLDHDYDLRTPLYRPVIGAALYAAHQSGQPLDEAALANLRPSSR